MVLPHTLTGPPTRVLAVVTPFLFVCGPRRVHLEVSAGQRFTLLLRTHVTA